MQTPSLCYVQINWHHPDLFITAIYGMKYLQFVSTKFTLCYYCLALHCVIIAWHYTVLLLLGITLLLLLGITLCYYCLALHCVIIAWHYTVLLLLGITLCYYCLALHCVIIAWPCTRFIFIPD